MADGSVSESGNLPGLLGVRGLGLSVWDEDEDISGGNERRDAQHAHELNLDLVRCEEGRKKCYGGDRWDREEDSLFVVEKGIRHLSIHLSLVGYLEIFVGSCILFTKSCNDLILL